MKVIYTKKEVIWRFECGCTYTGKAYDVYSLGMGRRRTCLEHTMAQLISEQVECSKCGGSAWVSRVLRQGVKGALCTTCKAAKTPVRKKVENACTCCGFRPKWGRMLCYICYTNADDETVYAIDESPQGGVL